MTKDDIIRMAREAGPLTKGPFDDWCKRFANLVAAAEPENTRIRPNGHRRCKTCDDLRDAKRGRNAASIRARGTT